MPVGPTILCEEGNILDVLPQYLTFAENGVGSKGTVAAHKNIALCKTFITSRYEGGNGNMLRTVRIYEIVKGKAHLLYELPKDSAKAESNLWKMKAAKRATVGPTVVDEDEVAAAIASITGAM